MTEIEIMLVALDAYARKDDDIAANNCGLSFAPSRRCDRSEFKNGAHATSSEIEPVNPRPRFLGGRLRHLMTQFRCRQG